MCHAGSAGTVACGHSCHACLLLECMAFLLLGIPDHRRDTGRTCVWNGGFREVPRPPARAGNCPASNPLSLLANCLFFLPCHRNRQRERGTALPPTHFLYLSIVFSFLPQKPSKRGCNRSMPNPLSLLANCLFFLFCHSDRQARAGNCPASNPLSLLVNCLFFSATESVKARL